MRRYSKRAGTWGALCLAGALQFFSTQGRAAETSELENSVRQEALAERGYVLEPKPDGKLIESIEFKRLEVFDARDPVPDFLNLFHGRSREEILRRELLFREAEPYRIQRIEETERNLRGRRQLSLVNIVAARGSTPESVRLVVIVKDVWSLRLNSDFAIGSGGIEYLLLNPAEENVAGTWLSLGLLYRYEPLRQLFGGRFVAPRLFGTRYFLGFQAAPILSNSGMNTEGSTGQIVFERPQYSLRTEYAFGARISWVREVSRRMIQTSLREFVYVDPLTNERATLPWQYDTERYAAEYYGIRSWGLLKKTDVLFGLEIDSRRAATEFSAAPNTPVERAFVEQVLPISDRRFSPFAQLRLYEGRFHRTLGVELLGLQEDFRLGYDVLARVSVAGRTFASSRDLVGGYLGLGYTLKVGDGLARAILINRTVLANDDKNEGTAYAGARLVTPRLGRGRLHVAAEGAIRYFDYLNLAPYSLGGEGTLRGYRSGEFFGKSFVTMSAEYRSGSVDILSAQVGVAFFADLGAAAKRPEEFAFHSSMGVGLRILFPQADRAVLRLDYGVPLIREPGAPVGLLYATFGQAVPFPSLSTPSVTSGLSAL